MFNDYNSLTLTQSSFYHPTGGFHEYLSGEETFLEDLSEQEFESWAEAVEIGTEIEDRSLEDLRSC